MEKVVLHCDLNCFYASVEMLFNPALRKVPMAVGGNAEKRHGIILTKNPLAKKAGIKTGEALWQAREKCPNLVVVPPNFSLYLEFSKKVRAIFEDYTDQIEPFGIDECWLDVTGSVHLFNSPSDLAREIMQRILEEVGLTVSIGLSDNKVFSKLGSDMAGTQELVIIDREHLDETIYPLDVSELLFIGYKTKQKLNKYHIYTIGDLAQADLNFLELRFKKWGHLLYQIAHGIDQDHVLWDQDSKSPVKSIGNSITAVRDLVTEEDYKIILYRLAESVCLRQSKTNLWAYGLQVHVRDFELSSQSKQMVVDYPLLNSKDVAQLALQLCLELIDKPIRSLGIKLFHFKQNQTLYQPTLFEETNNPRDYKIDQAMAQIRKRFGDQSINRGIMAKDRKLSDFYPSTSHVIFPISYLKKGINKV